MSLTPGIWGLGEINNLTLFNRAKACYKGHRLRYEWKKYETSRNVFNPSYLEETYNVCYDNDLDIISQGLVAPVSSNITPPYLFSSPDNVPLVTTTTSQTFPYYFNDNYEARYLNLHAVWRAYIAGLPSDKKAKHKGVFGAEGPTGDEGWYKGDATNPAYDITNNEWNAWKRGTIWNAIYDGLAADLPGVQFIINSSNNGENFAWGNANLAGINHKFGHPAHTYNLSDEKNYMARGIALWALDNGAIAMSEHEGTTKLSWYKISNKQNLWAIICNAMMHRMSILTISPKTINDLVGTDLSAFFWANDHMGIRDVSDTNKAWCQLRMCIDLNDTVKWSVADYGPVIDPTKLSAHNAQVNAINTNPDLSAEEKAHYITDKIIANFNPARLAALQADYPDASYVTLNSSQDRDAYNSDYIVNGIPDNYGFWITQIDPEGTSKGYWRIGPTTDFYGRFGRGFDNANGKTNMYFTTELTSDNNYQMKFYVQYFDKPGCDWSFTYHNGTTEVTQSFSTAGTNTWKKQLITLDDFQGGGHLTNSADFILNYESGDDTIFGLLEGERVAENVTENQPPIVIITTPNSTLGYPTNSISVTATAVDGDGTITGLLWTRSGGTAGGTATITSPTTADTSFTGMSVGLHVFRLTATDDADATSYDEIKIVVSEEDTALLDPVVSLGADRETSLDFPIVYIEPDIDSPTDITSQSFELTDGDETGFSIVIDEDGFNRAIIFTQTGVYTFLMSVTNDSGTSTDSITITVYPPASSNNTGRYAAYRSADVELGQTGYLKAWISLLLDFDTLNEPAISIPGVLGEKYSINTSHVWESGKEAIPVYIRKDQLEAPADTIGEIGTLQFLWTPKIFVIGDGAKIMEMMVNWLNEDIVLFVQDECNPSKYIQFGSECYPCNVQKNSFTSGTLKSGQKGFFLTLESLSKYFYNGSITERL